MPRLEEITIENFRSIGDEPICIKFHQNMPITFVGEITLENLILYGLLNLCSVNFIQNIKI